MPRRLAVAAVLLLLAPASGSAQLLQVPSLPRLPLGDAAALLREVKAMPRAVDSLARDRLRRIAELPRAFPDQIALDDRGDPARMGEIIVTDPDDAVLAAAAARGFRLIARERLDGLDIEFARFAAPRGRPLAPALKVMRALAGNREVSSDQLHFTSGGTGEARDSGDAGPAVQGAPAMRIGMIDGGVSMGAGLGGTVTRRGFAAGAPAPGNHGTAIASLLLGTPTVRGAAAGASLWAADVYGSDPAGGSASAIARALAWLSAARVPVTVVSLVGPANPLLARTVAAVQARGMIVVAAVGNDGPAAPPAYPASYPGVVAVTAVDRRERVLIEAGRARHLDFAAPGADMLAANAAGRAVAVRGTSFAAPLVAARLAHFHPRAAPGTGAAALRLLAREARLPAARGKTGRYGRGIVCGACATRTR